MVRGGSLGSVIMDFVLRELGCENRVLVFFSWWRKLCKIRKWKLSVSWVKV